MITGLIISSGHTNVTSMDRGAASADGKYVEGILTVEAKNILVKYIKSFAATKGIDINKYLLVDRDDTALAGTLAFLRGRTKPTDILIDIHFNAGPVTARGTEVLIPASYTKEELEIADKISDIFGNVLGTPERGRKVNTDGVKDETDSNRGSLGWMRLPGINILIEVEFLSNPTSMKVYDEKKEECWKQVAQYLISLL